MPTKDLEALARFVLGGEIAGLGECFGAVLGGQQGLQRRACLTLRPASSLPACATSRAPTASCERAMASPSRRLSPSMLSATWPCSEGGAPERGVLLVPAALGIAQHIVGRERRRNLAAGTAARSRFASPAAARRCPRRRGAGPGCRRACAAGRAMVDPSRCRFWSMRSDHLRLVLQLTHLVVDLLERAGGGEQVLLVVGRIEHGQLRGGLRRRSSPARRR